jgi:hypothetical protein
MLLTLPKDMMNLLLSFIPEYDKYVDLRIVNKRLDSIIQDDMNSNTTEEIMDIIFHRGKKIVKAIKNKDVYKLKKILIQKKEYYVYSWVVQYGNNALVRFAEGVFGEKGWGNFYFNLALNKNHRIMFEMLEEYNDHFEIEQETFKNLLKSGNVLILEKYWDNFYGYFNNNIHVKNLDSVKFLVSKGYNINNFKFYVDKAERLPLYNYLILKGKKLQLDDITKSLNARDTYFINYFLNDFDLYDINYILTSLISHDSKINIECFKIFINYIVNKNIYLEKIKRLKDYLERKDLKDILDEQLNL